MDPDRAVVLVSLPSSTEAELVAGMLRSNGVGAMVSGNDAGGTLPQLAMRYGARVLVRAVDLELAQQLMDEPVDAPD